MIVTNLKEFEKRFPSWKNLIQLVALSAVILGAGESLPLFLKGVANLTRENILKPFAFPVQESPFNLGFHSIVSKDDFFFAVFAGPTENGFDIHIAKSFDADIWEDEEIIRYKFGNASKENLPKSLRVGWDDTEPSEERLKIVWGQGDAEFTIVGSFDQKGKWSGSHAVNIVPWSDTR